MTRQTYHTDVVGEVFAAELGAKAKLFGCFLEGGLKLNVAEGMAVFVAVGGQIVEVFYRSFLYHLEVFLSRCAANHECDVVGRAGCGAERTHLLDQERNEFVGVDACLGLLVEVCLVGRTAAFCNEKEVVFTAFGGVDVDLRRKVATRVHLFVHGERRVLAVAQVIGGVGEVYAVRYFLFVVTSGKYVLSFRSVADGSAGVLAEWKLTFCGHFGIAEHGESYKLVVLACFGVRQNLGHHEVVLAAQHEGIVVRSLTGEDCKGLGVNNEEFVAAPVLGADVI